MNNTAEIFCLSLAIVVASATFTMATGDATKMRHGARHSFTELDANGDGQITKDELTAHRIERFKQADADGDGSLSREELSAKASNRAERRISHMIERHDANGDGVLSMDEMSSRHKGGMFERIDSDGNGTVSEAEFEAGKSLHRKGHSQSE